jgi:hypothetical protein
MTSVGETSKIQSTDVDFLAKYVLGKEQRDYQFSNDVWTDR